MATSFLPARSKRKDKSHFYVVKQAKCESVQNYMARFTKAVLEVKTCEDDTLIHAF